MAGTHSTQREVDPYLPPNPQVYEGCWVYDQSSREGPKHSISPDGTIHASRVPFVVTKIEGGYARLEKDPWAPVRAVRTGHLEVIERKS